MMADILTPALPRQTTTRGRGRPRKYSTENDRLAARRAQVARSVKAWRQRRSAARRSGDSLGGDSASPVTDDTTSPKDDIVAMNFDENKFHDAEEDLIAYDRASFARSSTYGSDTSLVIAQDRKVQAAPRKPPELLLNDTSLLLDSLLPDFLRYTNNSETWFPWAAISSLPGAAGALVNQGNVAAFAGSVAIVRNDKNMMRLAEGAYFDTIRSMRHYTDDQHVKHLAVPLIIMTSCMISYEFKDFLHGNTDLPKTTMWAHHREAASYITERAGPDAFRSGLGVRVLLGVIPQALTRSIGLRTASLFAGDEFNALLQSIEFPAFKDSIWTLGVHVPGLMQELDVIKADASALGKHTTAARLLDLYLRTRRLSEEFTRWMEIFPRMKTDLDESFNMFWSSNVQQPAIDMFFPRIEFATICAAQYTMVQWTFKLVLNTLLTDIRVQLDISGDVSALPAEEETETPLRFSHWICRSIEFWMKTPKLSRGTFYNCVSWPLRVAWCWFALNPDYASKSQWCLETSNKLREHPIGRVAEYCVDFSFSSPP